MKESKGSVLFISPAFFGYEVSISEAIQANGYDVDYYDERLSNNSLMKAVFRVNKSLIKPAIEKYYKRISDEIKNKKYDFFFLIKGEVVPESFINEFKVNNPKAKLIYYTYDSINNNNKNSTYILKHFDACFSFDFEDVKTMPELKLKHLFYTKDYIENKSQGSKKYTISFVGTLHSNRYGVIKALFSHFKDTYVFFFSPAKWFFWMEKTFKNHYKNIKWEDVSFSKLTKRDVASIFHSSKSVLDIQRFGQSGLTMRTFEVLASGAVLVTTNSYIKEAEFFDPDYIVVINDLNDEGNVLEIEAKAAKLTTGIIEKTPSFEKYFVNNWVKEFFE